MRDRSSATPYETDDDRLRGPSRRGGRDRELVEPEHGQDVRQARDAAAAVADVGDCPPLEHRDRRT
jgi:hypothetical protein